MKRLITGAMCLILLSAMVIPAAAQGRRDRYYRGGGDYGRRYETYGNYGYRDRRTYWDRHRDKTTVAIGTGVGAAIGGIAGGGRGAVIGALIGAGSSALYTYRLRDRNRDRRYNSYYRYGRRYR